MEETSNINLMVSGTVGVVSSILGAVIYHFATNFSSRFSESRRKRKKEKLTADLQEIESLHSDSSKFVATCFADIFYFLFIFAIAMFVSRLGFMFFELTTMLNLALWFSAMWIGLDSFRKVTNVKNFEKYKERIQNRINELNT